MNALKLLSFALFSSVVISCNDAFEKTQTMPEFRRNAPIVYTGDYVNVGLDVELPTPYIGVSSGQSSSTRSVVLVKDNIIEIDYSQLVNKNMKVYFALRKNNMQDDKVTYFFLDAKIEKTSDGKYKLKAEDKKIQLNTGGLTSDYYIQGVTLGPGTEMMQDTADKSYYFKMNTQNGFFESDVRDGNMLNSFIIPLATKWTPISNASNGKSVQINNLTFRPQGLFLKFEGKNNLVKDVEIRKAEIESYGFACCGNLRLGKLSKGLEINNVDNIKFEFDNSDNGGVNNNMSKINFDLPLKSGGHKVIKSDKNMIFYLYVMPNIIEGEKYRFSYRLHYKVLGSGPKDVYLSPKVWKTIPNTYLTAVNGDRYEVNQGKVITIKNAGLPESDLMITEFFHNNPGGDNYSMVEIYNPTNKDIDLRQYGLIRIRTVLDDNLAGIHPSDYSHFEHRPMLETQALVQDLWIDPSMPEYVDLEMKDGTDVRMMTVRQADGNLPPTSVTKEMFGVKYTDDNAYLNRYHYMSYPGTDKENSILKPGQTIIIGSRGFYDQIYDFAKPVGSGERNNDQFMPHGTASTGMMGIKESVAEKKCKYVMVVNNGVKKASSMFEGYQYSPFAGVMHHGTQHTLALVKWAKKEFKSIGPDKIVPIDESGPAFDYMVKYEESQWESKESKEYLKNLYDQYKTNLNALISSARFNGKNDDFGFIRNEYVMYPSIEFKYDLTDDENPSNQWTKSLGSSLEEKAKYSFGRRH